MFGIIFLPSGEWISISNAVGIVIGLVSSALLFWVAGKVVDKNPPGGNFKNAAVILSAPLFGFFVGRSVIVASVPMILAVVAGKQTELSFTVEDARKGNVRGCAHGVQLEELPVFFNDVCRIPEDVRSNLSKGSRVVVTGYGTPYGIFVGSLRQAD